MISRSAVPSRFLASMSFKLGEREMSAQMYERGVSIRVRFITVIQRYSGQREIEIRLPADPQDAIDAIIERFQIPWSGLLEKSVRIFINKELFETFRKSDRKLADGDRISFVPISGGG
jgi:molybdopterin converting factor small subunit